MGSSSEGEGPLSFFKVVRDPCAPHLSLPIAFVRRHSQNIPKYPTLKTATGGHSWKLKIKKIGQNYYFTHGWDQLVKDTHLRSKDFVVCRLIDPSTFQVLFFDQHGCAKHLPSSDGDEILSFQKVISLKTHKYTMIMPRKFVEGAGIGNEKSVKMKDLKGKVWNLGLMAERYDHTKYSLATNWVFFRRHHKLSDGDTCSFKFDKREGVINLTHIIRSKQSIKQESPLLGDGVKSEQESSAAIGGGGGVKVKVESELGGEEVAAPLEKAAGVEVKTEEAEAVKRKRGRPTSQKAEPEMASFIGSRHLVYF